MSPGLWSAAANGFEQAVWGGQALADEIVTWLVVAGARKYQQIRRWNSAAAGGARSVRRDQARVLDMLEHPARARELAPFGITVNTVAPGFIPVERHADLPGHVKEDYLASVPARRMGTPGDIAHAVSFLASEGAGFITGQRIVVDGGRRLGM